MMRYFLLLLIVAGLMGCDLDKDKPAVETINIEITNQPGWNCAVAHSIPEVKGILNYLRKHDPHAGRGRSAWTRDRDAKIVFCSNGVPNSYYLVFYRDNGDSDEKK